jgi:CDP-glycerol glycerophosphotransferase (TagB/SpsB family)
VVDIALDKGMSILTKIKKHGFIGSYRIVKTIICKPIRPIIYSFFRLFPIKENLIILESEPDYCDNAWALYHCLRDKGGYRFAWSVVNPSAFRNSNDTVFVSHVSYGLRIKAYYYYARAKRIIFTHCILPEFKKNGNQCLIYLTHGCPMKAGKGDGKLSFDFTISLGRNVSKAQSLFLGCDENKIIPLGYSRNDLLIHCIGEGVQNPFSKRKSHKVILWMPTFRQSVQKSLSEQNCDTETGLPLFSDRASLEELDAFLEKQEIEILVKIHHLQADKTVFANQYSSISFVTDEMIRSDGFQLYEIVGKSDALITDYSSVSFDYLLVDKPIGYVLDDIESYESDRGFVWNNVKEIMPGHHIYVKEQFYCFLSDICCGRDRYNKERHEVRDFIHSFPDDKSSERFISFFFPEIK